MLVFVFWDLEPASLLTIIADVFDFSSLNGLDGLLREVLKIERTLFPLLLILLLLLLLLFVFFGDLIDIELEFVLEARENGEKFKLLLDELLWLLILLAPFCSFDALDEVEEEITDEAFWEMAENAAAAILALAWALEAIVFTFLFDEKLKVEDSEGFEFWRCWGWACGCGWLWGLIIESFGVVVEIGDIGDVLGAFGLRDE